MSEKFMRRELERTDWLGNCHCLYKTSVADFVRNDWRKPRISQLR